jgi:hypothetical protein
MKKGGREREKEKGKKDIYIQPLYRFPMLHDRRWTAVIYETHPLVVAAAEGSHARGPPWTDCGALQATADEAILNSFTCRSNFKH